MHLKNISLLLFLALSPIVVSAQKYLSKKSQEINKQWNDNNFSSSKTFVENISNASEFSLLSKILKERSLLESLDKPEMVTIFAITDKAFSTLNKKERDSVLGDKRLVSSIVKFMTIPGRVDKNVLQIAVKKHGGKAYLTTLNGENLGVTQKDGQLYLIDSEGRLAAITATNFYHKNGLFHIVDGVIFPTSK